MTRDEQVAFCRKCTNRKFDPQQGIICRLTDQKADFQDSCSDFNLDEYVKDNKHEPDTQLEAREMIERLSDESIDILRQYQDFSSAIIGGLLLTLFGSIIWAAVSVITGYQIGYLAIGIGFLVGVGIRYFGAGVDAKFGILAGALSVVSCLMGNFLAQIAFAADAEGLSYLQTIRLFDYSYLPQLLTETFSPIDILFYALAVGAAYKYAFRQISPEELEGMHQQGIEPVPAGYNIRRPVVIAASIVLIAIVFLTNQGASGVVSFTYEDGSPMSSGTMVDGKEDGEWTFWYPNGKVQGNVSFNKGVPDGSWETFYESGKPTTVGYYENGNMDGIWINYYPEGQITDSGRYEMGRQEGRWINYYENGQAMQKGSLTKGWKEGKWQTFHANGQLESEGNMMEDEQDGLWKTWDENGQLLMEENYESGESKIVNQWNSKGKQLVTNGNGTFEEYYPTGELEGKGLIKNGKKHGPYVEYHPDGSKEKEGEYVDGNMTYTNSWKPDGTPVVVDGNGHYESFYNMGLVTRMEGDVKDGLPNGTWYTYYESGNIQTRVDWQDGKLTGKISMYYESGNTMVEGQQQDEKATGKWTSYYEDATLEAELNYKNGKLDGTQAYWGAFGNKIREELFENGKLIESKSLN